MIRIEDISKSILSKAYDTELTGLRLRCIQLYDKDIQKENKGFESGRLNRPDFIQKYRLLSDEMTERKIKHGTHDIDRDLFKSSMSIAKNGIDVASLGEHTIIPNIAVMVHPISKEVNIAFDDGFNLIEEIVKAEASKLVSSQTGKNCWLYTLKGDEVVIPLFDLVLKSKLNTFTISKPYPNEHAARLQDPSKYDSESFRTTEGGTIYGSKKVPNTINIIWGKIKGNDNVTPQALRFKVDNWSAETAKKWLKDNNISYISFDAATGKIQKSIWSSQYINDLPDSAFLYVEGKIRHLPYKNIDGEVDLLHLRNALARLSQTKISDTVKAEIKTKAEKILAEFSKGGPGSGISGHTTDRGSVEDRNKSSFENLTQSLHKDAKFGDHVVFLTGTSPDRSMVAGTITEPDKGKGIGVTDHNGNTHYIPKEDLRTLKGSKSIKDFKKFEKGIKLFSIEKQEDQHLVCGVVYEPDITDAQNDQASEEEIRKAAHQFMEEVQILKVNHSGKQVKVKPVESYIAPADFEMCGQKVKKGSWVMTCKVSDEELWKDIKDNRITGYSMAGYARTE